MRIAATILLCLIALSAEATVGIIDRTESHLSDMVKHVDGEVIGILIESREEIAIAIQGLIILDVDAIAIPIQTWRYDSDIARMIAVARSRGIKMFGPGTNNRWYHDDVLERILDRPTRYIGVKYIDRTFWRSASECCVRSLNQWKTTM